jgi:hypothetical protein
MQKIDQWEITLFRPLAKISLLDGQSETRGLYFVMWRLQTE